LLRAKGTKKKKRNKEQGFLVNGQIVRETLHVDKDTRTEAIKRSNIMRIANKRLAGYELGDKHDLGMTFLSLTFFFSLNHSFLNQPLNIPHSLAG